MKNYESNKLYFLPVTASESNFSTDNIILEFKTGFKQTGLGYNKISVADKPNLLLTEKEIAEMYEDKMIPIIEKEKVTIMKGKYYQIAYKCGFCGNPFNLQIWDEETKDCIGQASILRDNTYPKYCPSCGKKIVID